MILINNKYLKIVFSILFLKLIIMALLPITGDEAYFVKWGQTLSSGYYDHPPMVGWLIYFMSFISNNIVFFRFFAFVSTVIVAFSIYKILLLYKTEEKKALFISLIFLASPIDILTTLFTNDTALLLFGTLGTLFLLYSLEKEQPVRYSILAGIFLGFSFLSKYFAAFLMISLLLFSIFAYGKKAIKNIIIVTLVVSLFIVQNLYFNYNNCWNNIMFNFFARTADDTFNLSYLIVYFGFIVYLFSPWGLYFLFKDRINIQNNKLLKLVLYVLILAFIIFLKVSFTHRIGLHWFLLFIPFVYILFIFLTQNSLEKLFKYNAIFTFIHIILFLTIIFMPKTYFEKNKQYSNLVMFTQTKQICQQLDKYKDNELFALGYTPASILSYHCKKDIKMLFNNSKFGREDDKLLNVRTLDGQNIILFGTNPLKQTDDIYNVCQNVSVDKITINQADFFITKCDNFNYIKYKQYYLDIQKEKFYNIPKWLPIGKCYFFERYYK